MFSTLVVGMAANGLFFTFESHAASDLWARMVIAVGCYGGRFLKKSLLEVSKCVSSNVSGQLTSSSIAAPTTNSAVASAFWRW